MDSINQPHVLTPPPRIGIPMRPVWNTTPCPTTGGKHGNYHITQDLEDDEQLHHWVKCGYCFWEASAGVDPKTRNLELFYGDFDEIWNDGENWHSHHSVPVVQPNGEEWCLP